MVFLTIFGSLLNYLKLTEPKITRADRIKCFG